MKRILVIRGGAIGDFVLTLPALKLLRVAYPQARIEILGYRHIVVLAENRFYAEAVHSIEYGRLASFFAEGAELPTEVANHFASFDLVVSYLFDPDEIFVRNLKRCGVKNFLACAPKINGDEHAAHQLARPLAQLGLALTDPAAKLYPSESDRDFARAHYAAEDMIAIHPGSGSASKNWPLEQWIRLLNDLLLLRTKPKLLVVGGEADGEQLETLRSTFADQLSYAENLPLVNLAAVFEQCALFIGHDSGVSHIAAAVGTESVLLFGRTDPKIWAPANPKVTVIRSKTGEMSDIHRDEVLAAILSGEKIGEATS